jgi:hypothetical protein
MTDVSPELGMAAASAGWKAGHEAVLSGSLSLDDSDDVARNHLIEAYAAEPARAYMRQAVAAHGLTEAEGVRLFGIYMVTFARGARDQALDGGALRSSD